MKLHTTYLNLNAKELAVSYGDTLVQRYPKYKDRLLILQSLALYYDSEVTPRDQEKVKFYHEMILEEYPNINPEILEVSKTRLENIGLTLEELIEKQMNAI